MYRQYDELQLQLEVVELEEQLVVRRRLLVVGVTLGLSITSSSARDNDSISVSRSAIPSVYTIIILEALSYRSSSSRPYLRKLPVFKNRTIKKARDFLTALELTFALMPNTYKINASYILYSIIYLGRKPSEQQYLNYSISDL